VFDVTSRASFGAMSNWFQQVKEHAHARFSAVLVGNKVDLVGGLAAGVAAGVDAAPQEERAVSEEEARAWAAERGLQYFEVSAAQGTNVHESFMCILQQVEKLLPPKPPAAVQPLPAGWVAVESSARPGQLTYENQHTKERVATLPTKPARPAPQSVGVTIAGDDDDGGGQHLVPGGPEQRRFRCGPCTVQ